MSFALLLAEESNPLNTTFFDGTPIWELLTLAIVLLIGYMAIKAAIHGAKKGEPAHLGQYAACALVVLFIFWIGGHVPAVSNSDSFNDVGCMAKLTCNNKPTTTR